MNALSDPIAALASKLQGLIADGTLTVGAQEISASLAPLFTQFIPSGNLVIESCQVGVPGGQDLVQIFGTAADGCVPFCNMAIDARITLSSQGSFELTLFASATDPAWTLANSFIGFRATEPFGYLLIDSAVLTLSSAGDFSTAVGLSFSGSVPLAGAMMSDLISVFPGIGAIKVTGPVTQVYASNMADFSWSGKGSQTVQLGDLFPVLPELTVYYGAPTPGLPATRLDVGWTLDFGGSAPLSVYLQYPFDLQNYLSFFADLSGVPGFMFSMLSQLTGITKFGPMMPAQLPIPDDFTIKLWNMQVSGFDMSLVELSVIAATTRSWPIIDGVTLDNISFEFDYIPGDPLMLILGADFDLGQGVTLELNATYPGFAFSGALSSPGIDLKPLVSKYSPDAAALIPAGLLLDSIDFNVDPASSIYSFDVTVSSLPNQWPIALYDVTFFLDQISMSFGSTDGAITVAGSAQMALSSASNAPIVQLGLGYASSAGWSFSGTLSNLTLTDLEDAATSFFPSLAGFLQAIPFDLDISLVAVEITHGTTQQYSFTAQVKIWFDAGDADGKLNFVGSVQMSCDASGQHSGTVTGVGKYKTLTLTIQHDLSKDAETIFSWSDFSATWSPPSTAIFHFGALSLGDMVTTMVDAVTPEGFALVEPFDLLNSLALTGIVVTLDFAKKTATTSIPVDGHFGFLQVSVVAFTVSWGAGAADHKVLFSIPQGDFLGAPIDPDNNPVGWDVLDPTTAQPVPGFGNSLLDVHFLGLGQHFAPHQALDTTTVESALLGLEQAFLHSSDPIKGLRYASDASWIIALDAWLLDHSIWLGGLFVDDPAIYGVSVLVAANGRLPQFGNLHFEILYKKLGNDIGVYQASIVLPDSIRYLNFGAVGVTLPDFAIAIYTNGDFEVDFGFPYNNDFAVSFAVQMLPFLGSGGFYFGVLNGTTASNVPKLTSQGTSIQGFFSPVIEFGIGVAVGLGGSLSYGIASGGISLMLTGIVEGVFAGFNANGEKSGSADFYWGISGQVGILGRLFGVVNFAIVVARFDATIQVSVGANMAAHSPVTFNFTASITVSASISINLGLFSVTIGFSFDLSVTDSYTVGSYSASAWDPDAVNMHAARLRLSKSWSDPTPVPFLPLRWAPVSSTETFTLWLLPHITAASEVNAGVLAASTPQIVATTYIERHTSKPPTALSPFAVLAQGVLLWVINAGVNGKPADKCAVLGMRVDFTQASRMFAALDQAGSGAAFTLFEIETFLSAFGKFTIQKRSKLNGDDELTVALFPIAPSMTLQILDGAPVAFSSINRITAAMLDVIRAELLAMQPGYPGAPDGAIAPMSPPHTSDVVEDVALSTFLFLDYFALIAKGVVQGAMDVLKQATQAFGERAFEELTGHGTHLGTIARLNWAVRLRVGLELSIPPGARVGAGQTYRVADGPAETLGGLGRRFGVGVDELALHNRALPLFASDAVLTLGPESPMIVSDIIDAMQHAAAFDNIAGQATRVFLQGLRPSWPRPGAAKQALYAITGQQFDASGMKAGDSYALAAPGTKWIDASDATVTLDDQDSVLLQAMLNVQIAPAFTSVPQAYRSAVVRRFTLSAPVLWTSASAVKLACGGPAPRPAASPTVQTIWQFPSNLLQLMVQHPLLAPEMTLAQEVSSVPYLAGRAAGDAVKPLAYSWATAFAVKVARIASAADPSKNLPFIYNLSGTNPAGSAFLEQLLKLNAAAPVQIDQIYLLFPLQPGNALPAAGVKSDALAGTSFFVMQTNLSTASSPPGSAAVFNDAGTVEPVGMASIDMLRLIWECSVVRSGGYQLFYQHMGGAGGSDAMGLPDFLFAKDGTAELTVLVQYAATDDTLKPYWNAAVVGQAVDPGDTYYLEPRIGPDDSALSPLMAQAPVMSAGHGGFTALRTFPEPPRWRHDEALAPGAADQLTEQQYQLLEYAIVGTADFTQGVPGLPLTLTADASGADSYAAVVPIAQLATDPGVNPGLAGQPPPADDPYRGIGRSVQIDLAWHDVFGNVITTDASASPNPYQVSVPVWYFDDLVPVSAWPGVSGAYEIVDSLGTPTLTVTLTSDSSQYDPANKQVGANWQTVVASTQTKLAAVYYQIARNVEITLQTSLDPQAAPVDMTAALLGFVVEVYAYLGSLRSSGVYTANRIQKQLTIPVNDSADSALFALSATLTVARTGLVDPAIDTGSAARSVASVIKPLLWHASDPTQPGTLTKFANDLQGAFPTLRVGTCTPDSIAGTSDLWLMRLGVNGFSCKFSDPRYFSLQPLAVAPLSIANLALYPFDASTPLPHTTPVTRSFANVDLNLLAKNLMAAVDQFLSPDFVIPAWQCSAQQSISPNPVDTVLSAKAELARRIPYGLAVPYASQNQILSLQPYLAAARATLEQNLLIRLSTAYQIDSIVAVRASGAAPSVSLALAPRLLGKVTPTGSGASDNGVTLSTASVPLCASLEGNYLAFTYTAPATSKVAVVNLDVNFDATHLQFNLQSMPPPMQGYTASSWLSFVTPLQDASGLSPIDSALGSLAIPLPLKAFPTAPAMVAQRASGFVDQDGTVATTRLWGYAFTYDYVGATQDDVHARVDFTNPAFAPMAAADASTTLPGMLLQFSTVWPDILAVLNANAGAVQDAAALQVALESFGWIVEQVANLWPQDGMQHRDFGGDAGSVNFVITQDSVTMQGPLGEIAGVLRVKASAPAWAAPPWVDIANYQTTVYGAPESGQYVYVVEGSAPPTYLAYTDALSIARRSVSMFTKSDERSQFYDLLTSQQAWGAISIARNEWYGEEPGNTAFVYRTPYVRSVTPVLPLLDPTVALDMGKYGHGLAPAPLSVFLAGFLTALLTPQGGGAALAQPMQIAATFRYVLSTAADLKIDVPILLSIPQVVAPDSQIVSDMSLQITEWISNKGLAARPGRMLFTVTLYSSTTPPLPVLKLNDIFIDTSHLLWDSQL